MFQSPREDYVLPDSFGYRPDDCFDVLCFSIPFRGLYPSGQECWQELGEEIGKCSNPLARISCFRTQLTGKIGILFQSPCEDYVLPDSSMSDKSGQPTAEFQSPSEDYILLGRASSVIKVRPSSQLIKLQHRFVGIFLGEPMEYRRCALVPQCHAYGEGYSIGTILIYFQLSAMF